MCIWGADIARFNTPNNIRYCYLLDLKREREELELSCSLYLGGEIEIFQVTRPWTNVQESIRSGGTLGQILKTYRKIVPADGL